MCYICIVFIETIHKLYISKEVFCMCFLLKYCCYLLFFNVLCLFLLDNGLH
nr:MAG TPA: hypothetical protein [Caudoviricetes sp.]